MYVTRLNEGEGIRSCMVQNPRISYNLRLGYDVHPERSSGAWAFIWGVHPGVGCPRWRLTCNVEDDQLAGWTLYSRMHVHASSPTQLDHNRNPDLNPWITYALTTVHLG